MRLSHYRIYSTRFSSAVDDRFCSLVGAAAGIRPPRSGGLGPTFLSIFPCFPNMSVDLQGERVSFHVIVIGLIPHSSYQRLALERAVWNRTYFSRRPLIDLGVSESVQFGRSEEAQNESAEDPSIWWARVRSPRGQNTRWPNNQCPRYPRSRILSTHY